MRDCEPGLLTMLCDCCKGEELDMVHIYIHILHMWIYLYNPLTFHQGVHQRFEMTPV